MSSSAAKTLWCITLGIWLAVVILGTAHADDGAVVDLTDSPAPANGPSLPKLITEPPAFYPTLSRRMGREGSVVVTFVVGTDGTVSDAVVTQSCGWSDLDNGAVARVLDEFYRPASQNGHNVPVRLKRTITYQLSQ